MAYINTGDARNKTLTVTKGAYSQSYNLCDGFIWNETTYASLSDDEFAKLSDSDYERRRADFIAHVCFLEPGLQTDCPDMAIGSVEYDAPFCLFS